MNQTLPPVTARRRGQRTRNPLLFLPILIALLAALFLDPTAGPLRAVRAEQAAAAPNTPPTDPMTNPMVQQVIETFRERDGQEPDSQIIVDALDRRTAGRYQKGKYSQAEQVARAASALAERKLGKEHPDTGVNQSAICPSPGQEQEYRGMLSGG
uniref:Uncharacterized protein n=1 Tax=Candidatus Kentrum sp. FM TaxID=2126340 RepID=A0A450SPY6_9GAMM|nr:MAG: hypothetical protein BECKFM1743C_GA0114222_101672 [Candidatus Kentron sp. FM]VFJ59254.1 MAG: hypothetical protein BECKFM1743A_GA0114220_102335 [Candidatus Kentron sp. FM]VFK11221.1 MAG: hypothetical protein BECKFM1743B_GA0114221_101725 [Candidatus Kentron sp. FM]